MFTLKFEIRDGGYKFTYPAHNYCVSLLGGSTAANSSSEYSLTAYASADDSIGQTFLIGKRDAPQDMRCFDRVYIENQSGKTIDSFKAEYVVRAEFVAEFPS